MITGTIKDYTITTLQNILGVLVIQKGTQTNEIKILNRRTIHTRRRGTRTIHTNMLDNLDIHTSNGLHIKSLKTSWHYTYTQQKRMEPVNTQVTYTSQVHPEDIHKDIRNLTKQTLWEIILILIRVTYFLVLAEIPRSLGISYCVSTLHLHPYPQTRKIK